MFLSSKQGCFLQNSQVFFFGCLLLPLTFFTGGAFWFFFLLFGFLFSISSAVSDSTISFAMVASTGYLYFLSTVSKSLKLLATSPFDFIALTYDSRLHNRHSWQIKIQARPPFPDSARKNSCPTGVGCTYLVSLLVASTE